MMRANEVWNEQENKKALRLAAMKPIMTQLEQKIMQQAIHNPKAPYLIFEVPSFIFGYPLYDMKDAIEFLMNALIHAGYWAWNLENKYLFVSWIKPVKTRDSGRSILTTNYRPSVYDPSFLPNT